MTLLGLSLALCGAQVAGNDTEKLVFEASKRVVVESLMRAAGDGPLFLTTSRDDRQIRICASTGESVDEFSAVKVANVTGLARIDRANGQIECFDMCAAVITPDGRDRAKSFEATLGDLRCRVKFTLPLVVSVRKTKSGWSVAFFKEHGERSDIIIATVSNGKVTDVTLGY